MQILPMRKARQKRATSVFQVNPSHPAFSHIFSSISFPSVTLAYPVQSILPIRRFSSKFTQISNAIASTAYPQPVPTSLSQSILPITTTQRTENLVFRASAQSILPQTTAYPCRPVDPRQNGCLLPFTPCSQYSLTTPCVRPFCPVHPRPSRSSLPAPLRASIFCSEGSHCPFSHSLPNQNQTGVYTL